MDNLALIWKRMEAIIFIYLLMHCSKNNKNNKKQLNRHIQTGLSLCIKVHNGGGLVAAPGELEGFWDSLINGPIPKTTLFLYLLYSLY